MPQQQDEPKKKVQGKKLQADIEKKGPNPFKLSRILSISTRSLNIVVGGALLWMKQATAWISGLALLAGFLGICDLLRDIVELYHIVPDQKDKDGNVNISSKERFFTIAALSIMTLALVVLDLGALFGSFFVGMPLIFAHCALLAVGNILSASNRYDDYHKNKPIRFYAKGANSLVGLTTGVASLCSPVAALACAPLLFAKDVCMLFYKMHGYIVGNHDPSKNKSHKPAKGAI